MKSKIHEYQNGNYQRLMSKTLYTTLLAFATCTLFAQSFTLEQSTATYQELTNATDITGGELWDDEIWTMPIGFDFELFGKTYTEFTVHANGFITDTLDTSIVRLGLLGPDLVDGAFLIDFNNPIPVVYETSGAVGNQILKLQWKQANVWGADSSNIANYQIWFYEATGDVEFHFGDTKLDNVPGITVQKYTQGAFVDDGFALSGSPSNALASDIANIKLNSTPTNGTVYTFKRTGGSPAPTGIEKATQELMTVYPNPTTDFLNIRTTCNEYEILNILGERVQYSTSSTNLISVSSLPNGAYFLNLKTKDSSQTIRFIKR